MSSVRVENSDWHILLRDQYLSRYADRLLPCRLHKHAVPGSVHGRAVYVGVMGRYGEGSQHPMAQWESAHPRPANDRGEKFVGLWHTDDLPAAFDA